MYFINDMRNRPFPTDLDSEVLIKSWENNTLYDDELSIKHSLENNHDKNNNDAQEYLRTEMNSDKTIKCWGEPKTHKN